MASSFFKRLAPAWIWRDTLRRRLALAFGGISLLMMIGLTGLLLKQQQDFLDRASVLRANALAHSMAQSSSSWVLANDVAGLQEVLAGFASTPNLDRAFVLSPSGQVLASTVEADVGQYVSDPVSIRHLDGEPFIQVLIANRQMIDVAAPIMVGSRLIGWVRLELNQEGTRANLRAVATTSLEFIVVTVAIELIAALLLARNIVRRLRVLMSVAAAIESGSRAERSHLRGGDEICQLGWSLNNMLDTIVASEQKLDNLNRVYAAWTESVATVVREADEQVLLQRICDILVDKIELRLAFVGVVDASGWIRVQACSDNQSSYLQALRISTDPSLPEGQGPLGRAIREGAPCIINDFLGTAETAIWHDAARESRINAVAGFPLRRNGSVIGGLSVYSSEVGYFSDDIITLLTGLVSDISYALDNFDHECLRKQAETELTLAASVFDNSQEGIMITDADKVILRVNQIYTQLTGYTAEEAVGKTPEQLAPALKHSEHYREIWRTVDSQHYWQGEVVNRRKDGQLYPEWLTITQVRNKAGEVTHYVATFIDITDRKLNEERIYKLAFYDPLTSLPNRRLLIDRLRETMVGNQRTRRYGALMFMDLDRFKILNDTQGHDIGDQLLIAAGQRISNCVREGDTVARLGGDEFVILLDDLSEDADTAAIHAQRVGNKVLSALNQVYRLHRPDAMGLASVVEHHSSASIGVTLFLGSEIDSDDLLKQADMAMYQAKQDGRNTLCLFDPDMQTGLNQRAALETDLRNALTQNQFQLYYQIQVDEQARPIGAEALLRWRHPQRGAISPAEFIPLAEDTGLIVAMGYWVLIEACNTLVSWARNPLTADLVLAVNISARQLGQSNFVEQLQAILIKTGANPRRLELEITESTVLDSVENTIETMQRLLRLGLSFSMDDFGTGYSSLSYLQRLPLAQLKIDGSFVRDLHQDSNDAAIIRTILMLGNSLGLQVVAEGVETEAQRDYLQANGCRMFQGYLFGKPEPLSEFEQRFSMTADSVAG